MQNNVKRILSAIMALVLFVGLLPGIVLPAEAATVNYVYDGNYIYNWGERGTTATFLSPNAEKFYEDNNTSYEELAALSGSTSTSSVPSSALYRELKDLMSSNHSYKTGYDATKNLYQYTDCQNGGGKISSFYSGKAIGPSWDGGWNREHTWPNSKGLGGQDENDIMMLRPTSTSENSTRGNTAYGQSSGYYDPNKESNGKHNLHGDVARIMLYTYVRWGNTSYMWGKSGVMESREVLLQWMEEDPVDTWELGRNDAVEAITGTRNVFVDYPELAFILFGADIPAEYTTPSGSAAASGFTITAVSNNTAWGTVSVSGRTINASATTGYAVADYTVLSGTATVTRTGNSFVVSASDDVTVQINFAPRTESTVLFVQQDGPVGEERAYTGDSITLPAHQGTVATGHTFVGWVEKALEETITVPTFYAAGSKYTVGGNTTLYALYSRFEGGTGNTSNVFEPYTGALTEGDYVIVGSADDGDFAMVAADTGKSRLQTAAVSYSSGDILSPAANTIWHIAPTGGYWTIYNAATGKYAGGNGTKNQAVLLSSADDAAKWTASGTSTYEFVNKGNDAKGVNPLLRRNGSVGFACYAKNTNVGAPLKLYKRLAGTMYYFTGAAVAKPEIIDFGIKTQPDKTVYQIGEDLDTTGLTLILIYSDDSTKSITAGYTVSGFDSATAGTKKVTVTYEGMTAIFRVTVVQEAQELTAPVVTVSGTALTWAVDPMAECYEVYRSTSKSGKYVKVNNEPVIEGVFVDTTAEVGKTYYYKVVALAAVPEYDSDYSKVVSIAYKCVAPNVEIEGNESTGKPEITWEAVNGAKKYTVYRATSETGKYSKLGTTTKLTYTDTKADVGKTYYYKVIANASSSSYNSGYSNIVSETAVCAVPSVKISVDTTTGKPSLSWSKVSGAVTYKIYRQLPGEDIFSLIAEQKGTSFKDTTAPVDAQCIYVVQTVGKTDALDSAFSKEVSAISCVAKPSVKGSVETETGKPQLTWAAVEGAHSYIVLRGTKKSDSLKYYTQIAVVGETFYIDNDATVGKTYYYKVIAVGEAAQGKESSYVKITGKCAAPVISVQIDENSGKPTISWETISSAKKYTVYRATSETGKYSKLGTTTKLTYTDTKADVGKTYYYKVIANASSSSYNSGYSNIVSTTAVCAASKLTAKVDAATGKPSLSWSKVTGAVAYRIYRQLPGEDGFTMVAEVTKTSFLDTTAPIDTNCVYKIMTVGKNESLNSAFTAEIAITSGIARPTVKGEIDAVSGVATLTWNAVEGAVKYEIYRSTKSSKGFTLYMTVEALFFEDVSAVGKTYYYKVVAVGQVGKSAETSAIKLTGKCATPVAFAAVDAATGKPHIAWEKVSGAKSYEIYRATSRDGKFSKVGTSKSDTYIDTKAKTGTTYYYKVKAIGSKSSYNSGLSAVTYGATPILAMPKVTVTVNSLGQPVITWKKVSEAVSYEIVYFDEDMAETEEALITTTTKTTFTVTDAVPGKTYYFYVRAVAKNPAYTGTESYPVSIQAACAAPKLNSHLSADGKPAGWWDYVEGATSYIVYRSTSKSSGYKLLDTVEDAFFIDDTAKKGKTYYYKITAVCEGAESTMSNYIKIKSK